ncbi:MULTISPECIES: amino acid ABC transporter substrate-binding protein [Paracoccus]|jgi:general L-amino acid transport system substrate-binding protein|uniref:Amino acid ABC transporter substrate-binding protein n=2 Tax=Paracoccus TaxID=265 RepID=A0A5C4R2S3_9RHOB|nr:MULTISPECIES: amino acid ABC transporter substrate-binding protein [Paracoccus]AZY93227.1 amino acid ABC transporter substrate-binding protein [Paracoccus sp. Arc7-R13]KIX18351.1 amino acid ABC transporter substrate-binding protein [Paracoccus sp. 228]KJZ31674.1 amino acid ABC transporter substrate-binding protein [Paracoccus sp. S4493]MCO6364839.1 transporter substrate-binding domain-containing protein [Paracoccus sp. 08]QXI64662.1 Putative amino-acid ABC transporter-binding protein YhdW [|tara:strand:+ start:2788 stop:3813 length:1026 start_codon:yes stop_codon:yes gene_type:complete
MKKSVFLGTAAAATLLAGMGMAQEGSTLAQVKERGELNCGVNTGLVGFAAPDASGNWTGFDVAFCRALAAAVLGDPAKVKFVPTTGQTRFTALSSGEVDVLARNSTWTYSRDTDLKLDFIGVNYYDGQGFMVRSDLGVTSAKELDGATICIQTGTTTELNLADYFRANNMTYTPVNIDSNAEGEQQYMAGACDAYTTDASGLAATRAAFADPETHIILPEIISKEPLGPAVRHGDSNWGDIARWTLNALIAAEEYGVTSRNIEELVRSSENPEVQRLLGTTDELGAMMGLDAEWARRAILAGGNYGEIFAANIGEQTPIGLARGLNAQWTQGGLLYAPPFR